MIYDKIVRKINIKKLNKFLDEVVVMKCLAEYIQDEYFQNSLNEVESQAKQVLELFE